MLWVYVTSCTLHNTNLAVVPVSFVKITIASISACCLNIIFLRFNLYSAWFTFLTCKLSVFLISLRYTGKENEIFLHNLVGTYTQKWYSKTRVVGLSVIHVKPKGLHRTTSNLNRTEIGVTSFQAITCGTEKK